MGYWGTGLYSNDCTCDVRDSYIRYLGKGYPNEEAWKKTIDCCSQYLGTDEEPLMWYALADTQWKIGRLIPYVKQKAIDWLEKAGGISLWDKNENNVQSWKKVINALMCELNAPQNAEIDVHDLQVSQYNPGNIGDVFAYRFHGREAKNKGYIDKYILMQKVGEIPHHTWPDESIPQMIVYDMLFDRIPEDICLSTIRMLPFSVASTYMPTGRNPHFPMLSFRVSFELYNKRFFPKKYMSFVGSYDIPPSVEQKQLPYSEFFWDRIERTLISFHSQWQNYGYQLYQHESVVMQKDEDKGRKAEDGSLP